MPPPHPRSNCPHLLQCTRCTVARCDVCNPNGTCKTCKSPNVYNAAAAEVRSGGGACAANTCPALPSCCFLSSVHFTAVEALHLQPAASPRRGVAVLVLFCAAVPVLQPEWGEQLPDVRRCHRRLHPLQVWHHPELRWVSLSAGCKPRVGVVAVLGWPLAAGTDTTIFSISHRHGAPPLPFSFLFPQSLASARPALKRAASSACSATVATGAACTAQRAFRGQVGGCSVGGRGMPPPLTACACMLAVQAAPGFPQPYLTGLPARPHRHHCPLQAPESAPPAVAPAAPLATSPQGAVRAAKRGLCSSTAPAPPVPRAMAPPASPAAPTGAAPAGGPGSHRPPLPSYRTITLHSHPSLSTLSCFVFTKLTRLCTHIAFCGGTAAVPSPSTHVFIIGHTASSLSYGGSLHTPARRLVHSP